jgi:hypothetical protein
MGEICLRRLIISHVQEGPSVPRRDPSGPFKKNFPHNPSDGA